MDFAAIYTTAMLSSPLVMVILWFFVLLPFITGQSIGANKSALITFTAFENAGEALGMTYWQNMKIVILPQAFRNMLPALLTQIIILFQDTSLVYAISGNDLLKGFDIVANNFGAKQEAYLMAALFYFIICFTLSQIVAYFQKKIAIIH